MEIYVAKIIKRTAIDKRVYDEDLKCEVNSVFMFDEDVHVDYCKDLKTAEEQLKKAMNDYYFNLDWIAASGCSFMFGDTERYHSNFVYLKNGNRLDYFALISNEELV